MKTLLLVRHAKSDWNQPGLEDFERPLNERGKHDAPAMAKLVREQKIKIDLFVSSPAKRAKKTAELIMKEFDAPKKKLLLVPELYEAPVSTFYVTIEKLKNKNNTIALFAHNPGITDFINTLRCTPVYDMPTCGIYALEIKTEKWGEFREAAKDFLFFETPKDL